MSKRYKFSKEIEEVKYPFVLTIWEPWQDQVKRETKRLKEKCGTSKSMEWGFEITDGGMVACIIARKI